MFNARKKFLIAISPSLMLIACVTGNKFSEEPISEKLIENEKKFLTPNPVVLAHRGDSEFFPENTLPAFLSAKELNVDVIETDLHLTKDKKIVVWHDANLKRISGKIEKVQDRTYEELLKLDAGKVFINENGSSFLNQGIKIPLLEDILKLLPNSRLNIDMKTKDPEFPNLLYALLKKYNAFDRVCVASFHSDILLKFREIAPEAITSFSFNEVFKYVLPFKFGCGSSVKDKTPPARICQIPASLAKPKGFMHYCKEKNIKVHVWTINEKEEINELLDIGVDGIFTDNPRLLQEVLKERKANLEN